ncbi:hypothetical protein ACLHDG_04100 [Sulfurovum sp. CS9]|uniref:hypothetical protein n=1 Tax=Sulfurovum sp. CS9 TaxID=3391146 RepID=UPI0039E8D8D6
MKGINDSKKAARLFLSVATLCLGATSLNAKEEKSSSYASVVVKEDFESTMKRMKAEKPGITKKHNTLLKERYDLSNRPSKKVNMSGGKPVQEGVRVKLPAGMTWEKLSSMSAEEIREKNLFPQGFMPLPHPHHSEGGMLFPKFHIDKVKKQDNRDLTRFDLDFDLKDHFLPEFPSPIYLTTRPDIGDVSQGKLVSVDNYFELFDGVLNPKQLEGLRLLVTPFPQQQFNATNDRRSEHPSFGVSCFDCHANGNSNAATHLVGDIRPQENRHRLDTPTLRGVYQQRLFGSQRALKTVEDFTEFEQRAAYFDGDHVIAAKKGVNALERGSQVHFMAEFQSILDFPPAPKLDVFDKLDPSKATKAELRGEAIFNGKGQCIECHGGPAFSDNMMHDMKVERFYKPTLKAGLLATAQGPIKSFPLRGIKDTPPYLHDGRLLTLEDTVEFFNLILNIKLSAEEKKDLVTYMQAL